MFLEKQTKSKRSFYLGSFPRNMIKPSFPLHPGCWSVAEAVRGWALVLKMYSGSLIVQQLFTECLQHACHCGGCYIKIIPIYFFACCFLKRKKLIQILAMPIRYLKQVCNGFRNSDKLDFWHLLKLLPLFSTHFFQLVEFYLSNSEFGQPDLYM